MLLTTKCIYQTKINKLISTNLHAVFRSSLVFGLHRSERGTTSFQVFSKETNTSMYVLTRHSGAEGILGEVVSPIQVSYLSESVSTSRFRICRTLNISSGSEWEIIFFVFFCKLPTGIKGATDQMLPWKAPNDPKTLPMGILHDYMSCWTTLGPFRYQRGP